MPPLMRENETRAKPAFSIIAAKNSASGNCLIEFDEIAIGVFVARHQPANRGIA